MKILQHLETPQYLKRRLFKLSDNLKYVGLIKPLECHHHLKKHEESRFREGVVLKRPTKSDSESWVDIGLDQECKINYHLVDGVRVSVRIDNFRERNPKFFKGDVVSSKQVEEETGMYWGYNVNSTSSFLDLFELIPEDCLNILISDQEKTHYEEVSQDCKYDMQNASSVMLFFAGESLHSLREADKYQYDVKELRGKFHYGFTPQDRIFGLKNIHLEEQFHYYCSKLFNN